MRSTTEQQAQFERDGFVVIDAVLSTEQLAIANAAMDRVYGGEYNDDRRPPRIRKPVTMFGSEASVHWILNARVLDRDLWDLATSQELGELAAGLLQTTSVSIVEDQLLKKPARGLPVNMHQDRAYWPFSTSDDMITAWIALVDMTAELGPLQLVKGSHRWGRAERPKELIRGSEAEWMDAVELARPTGHEPELVTTVMPAGSAVFFHSLTFHGSGRNFTETPRRALSLHWAGERCRMDLAQTAKHDHPYMFARIADGAAIVNHNIPRVYPKESQSS